MGTHRPTSHEQIKKPAMSLLRSSRFASRAALHVPRRALASWPPEVDLTHVGQVSQICNLHPSCFISVAHLPVLCLLLGVCVLCVYVQIMVGWPSRVRRTVSALAVASRRSRRGRGDQLDRQRCQVPLSLFASGKQICFCVYMCCCVSLEKFWLQQPTNFKDRATS